jgi:hypothetical protein
MIGCGYFKKLKKPSGFMKELEKDPMALGGYLKILKIENHDYIITMHLFI